MVLKILAILSFCAGVAGALLMIGLLFASTPNSSPKQMREIKMWIILTLVVMLLGLALGIWALFVARPQLAIALGLSPAVFSVVLAIYLVKTGR